MPAMLAGMQANAQRAADAASSPSRPINLIVVHCAATPSGKPLQRGTQGQPGYQSCATIIDGWHGERGFVRKASARAAFNPTLEHIGYHFVVDVTGEVFTGRALDEMGAHVSGHNAASIGICLVGGAERVARYTPAQWKSLQSIVLWQAQTLRLPLAAPKRVGEVVATGICGHRDLSPDGNRDGVITPNEWLKTCPGFDVAAWLANGLQPTAAHVWSAA